MKTLFLFAVCILISTIAYPQDNIMKKNSWSSWKTDTSKTHEGNINVINKRIKYTSDNCLITEEIIFFYDECNNFIRKAKIRSDCKRNIGEGRIIHERKYKSKCDKNKSS